MSKLGLPVSGKRVSAVSRKGVDALSTQRATSSGLSISLAGIIVFPIGGSNVTGGASAAVPSTRGWMKENKDKRKKFLAQIEAMKADKKALERPLKLL